MNRAFISNADKRTVIRQLIQDLKAPLAAAQITINGLEAIQTPSPTLKRRLNDGEFETYQMLRQLDDSVTHAIDILEFYDAAIESP